MGKRKAKKQTAADVYEAEEGNSDEDTKYNPRYDRVENYEYELPADFKDEEIDEDEAFNEEDDQLYNYIFKNRQEVSSDEFEDDGELTRDDFSEDDSEADRIYGKPKRRKTNEENEGTELDAIFGQDSGFEEDESEESDEDSDLDEKEEDRLRKTVNEVLAKPASKRQKLTQPLRNEAVPESEFNITRDPGQQGKLTIADLLAGLGSQSGKMTPAEKQLAKLAKIVKPLDPPLPGPIRARKERQAGYEDTKKDVSKWMPIIRANREAPTLIFSKPDHEVDKTNSTAALSAKFKPESTMEAEVAQLLKEAGFTNDESAAQAEESLALQNISAEEMEKRRNELAKMRSLLYKHESKAKHLAKIKSKDYHRRMKKSARLKAEKVGELGDEDFIRLQAEKAEYDRAKERLTLKHKNTSQWARRALKRGVNEHNDGKKEAIAEQLRLGEELRRRVDRADKVQGSDTDESDENKSDDESDNSKDGSDQELEDGGKYSKRTATKLRATAAQILNGDEEGDPEMSKGLFSLPFMKRAAEKQKKAAEKDARELLAEIAGHEEESQQIASGRRNFGLEGGTQVGDDSLSEVDSEDLQSDEDEDIEAKRERLKSAMENDRKTSHNSASTSKAQKVENGSKSLVSDGMINGKKDRQNPGKAQKNESSESDVDEDWGASKTLISTSGPVSVINSGQQNLQKISMANGKQNEDTESMRGIRSDLDYLLNQNGVSTHKKTNKKSEKSPQIVKIGTADRQQENKQGEEKDTENTAGNSHEYFLPAKKFTGDKKGYYFSKGPQGIGYYYDENLASNPRQRSKKGKKKQTQNGVMLEQNERDNGENLAVLDFAREDAENGAQLDGMSQRDLIAQAFAGDDVIADFEAEKQEEAEKEGPKIEAPSLLPGWGTWASNQKEPEWMAKAKLKVQKQKEAARQGRKDAKLENVIISEKYDKKASKYNVANLPFPYTSKDAFEGNMRQPLGSEFNTQTSFRHMTRPAIIKSTGVIIKPLRYSKAGADESFAVSNKSNDLRPEVSKISGGMTLTMKSRKALA